MNSSNESKAYETSFYEMQASNSYNSAKIVIPYLINMFHPKSVADVGCGVWTWLKAFEEAWVSTILWIDWIYVEQEKILIEKSNFKAVDLKEKQYFDKRYDIAISLEVGEHLPKHTAPNFIETITSLSDIVIFSAAQPLQWGQYHINEQRPEFRWALFEKKGYIMLDPLRLQLIDFNELGGYRQNIFVFIKFDVYTSSYTHLRKYNSEIIILEKTLFNTHQHLWKKIYQYLMIYLINLCIKLGIYAYAAKIFHKFKHYKIANGI